MIDSSHFTPLSALIGGVLIGTAAALFMLFNGRIAGISGIVGGLLRPLAGMGLFEWLERNKHRGLAVPTSADKPS